MNKCKPVVDVRYEPFTVCLFNGAKLSYDGVGFTATKPTIVDGEYSTYTAKNGCIIRHGNVLAPSYTPPACSAAPEPCCTGGGDSSVSISKAIGNTLVSKLDGLYASTSINVGDGLTIEGIGIPTDPYRITLDTTKLDVISVATGDAERVVVKYDDRTSIYTVALKEQLSSPTSFLGMSINQYGQITGVASGADTGVVTDVKVSPPLTVTKVAGGVVMLSLSDVSGLAGDYQLGGYKVSFSTSGVVSSIEKVIDINETKFVVGGKVYTVGEQGSITEIKNATANDTTYSEYSSVLPAVSSTATTRTVTISVTQTGTYLVEVRGNLGSASGVTLPAISPSYTLTVNGTLYNTGYVDGSTRISELIVSGVTFQAGDNVVVISGTAATVNTSPLAIKAALARGF